MPIIQREKIWFEGAHFERAVKVNAGGQFSIRLPVPVGEMFDCTEAHGDTKAECIRNFNNRVKEYAERKSTEKRVILFKIQNEISFADGIAMAVWAREYIETKTTGAGRKEFFAYKPVEFAEKTLDTDLYPRSQWEGTPSGREEAKNKIDWTPERADFLNKIATALTRIKGELNKLQDPADMLRIADSGRFLEDGKGESK